MVEFRLVTNNGNISFKGVKNLYELGDVDEESYIVFECDEFLVKEDRKFSGEYDIAVKKTGSLLSSTFLDFIFGEMKDLRNKLNELIDIRSSVYGNFKYHNRRVNSEIDLISKIKKIKES